MFIQCLSNYLRIMLSCLDRCCFQPPVTVKYFHQIQEWIYRKLQQTLEPSLCIFNSVANQSQDF